MAAFNQAQKTLVSQKSNSVDFSNLKSIPSVQALSANKCDVFVWGSNPENAFLFHNNIIKRCFKNLFHHGEPKARVQVYSVFSKSALKCYTSVIHERSGNQIHVLLPEKMSSKQKDKHIFFQKQYALFYICVLASQSNVCFIIYDQSDFDFVADDGSDFKKECHEIVSKNGGSNVLFCDAPVGLLKGAPGLRTSSANLLADNIVKSINEQSFLLFLRNNFPVKCKRKRRNSAPSLSAFDFWMYVDELTPPPTPSTSSPSTSDSSETDESESDESDKSELDIVEDELTAQLSRLRSAWDDPHRVDIPYDTDFF